jgi:hypothetical protein
MRLHTDATLDLLDKETTELGKLFRDFESTTCSIYKTRELKREMSARKRREDVKRALSVPKAGSEQNSGRQFKTINLQTYKFHSLGDYVSTIKKFGTTDSYTTAIVSSPSPIAPSYTQNSQGELEHRRVKSRYKRTNKKEFVRQLTRIERRQARIKLIRQRVQKEGGFAAEDVPRNPTTHHEIGSSENCKLRFSSFLEKHKLDPAATVSLSSWGGACTNALAGLLVKTQGASVTPYPCGALADGFIASG